MSQPIQKNRGIAVHTKLPDDTLLLRGLRGEERMGQPFAFRLDLLGTDAGIKPADMLGSAIRVTIETRTGKRELNGIVSRFGVVGGGVAAQAGAFTRYRAIMRPRLWLLSRHMHCRFFFDMSVTEIVKKLLGDRGVDARVDCTATYPKLQHCVQYCETDLDFMSRLLEREGIYYYFEHANGKDVVVLADDSTQAHKAVPGYESIAFLSELRDDAASRDAVYRWRLDAEIAPRESRFNAYDYLDVNTSEHAGLVGAASAEDDAAAGELQAYALRYLTQSDGDRHARVLLDAHRARAVRVLGRASARGMAPGTWFRLTGHPHADQNGDYLVVGAKYRLNSDRYGADDGAAAAQPLFDCTFTAVPLRHAWRMAPVTPAPRPGSQTATVIAPDGEEMATDKHGRVKVKFHWEQLDRDSSSEDMQRCWVRVAQPWAGKGWGAVFVPRAGQEVVVDFLDGDPDHPIIVGSVYNSNNPAPYIGASHPEIAAIRTDTLGESDKDRNELRFNDKSPQLLLYTGGRLDTYVKKNHFTWVGEDEHLTVTGRQLLHAKEQHVSVSAGQKVKVDGNASLKAGMNVVQQAGVNYVVEGQMVHIKGGATVVVEADAMVSLKAGGSFITVDAAGVQISGAIVGLNSGGAAGSGPGGSPESPEKPEKADDGSSVQVK